MLKKLRLKVENREIIKKENNREKVKKVKIEK